MEQRLKKGLFLIKSLQDTIDGLYITSKELLTYYTGHPLSSGAIYMDPTLEKPYLFTDKRYSDLFAGSDQWHLIVVQGRLHEAAVRAIEEVAKLRSTKLRIAFQGNQISYDEAELLLKSSSSLVWISCPDIFSQIRREKTPWEQEKIARSCALCEEGFLFLLQEMKPGISEKELAGKLGSFWLARGANGFAFDPIIAFGKKSAIPHWRASSARLEEGDIVLIDIGVVVEKYASDMTRTFSFGEPKEKEFDVWFHMVERALSLAEAHAKPGVFGRDLDGIVRSFFKDQGVDAYFTHSLGHGVGLEVHEAPRISNHASPFEGALAVGDVITLEPGLYFPERGGVRLENTYVVTSDGVRSYMKTPFLKVWENSHMTY